MTRETFISGSIYAIYLLIGAISTYIASLTSIVMALIVIVIEYIRLVGLLSRVYRVVSIIFVVNVGLVAYNGYKSEQLLTKSAEITESKSELTEKFLKKNWLKASTFERLLGQMQVVQELPVDYRVLTALYIALELSLLMLVYGLARKERLPKLRTTYDAYRQLKSSMEITNHSEFIRLIKSPKILGENWQNISKLIRNITNTGARPSVAYELSDDEYEKVIAHFEKKDKKGEK